MPHYGPGYSGYYSKKNRKKYKKIRGDGIEWIWSGFSICKQCEAQLVELLMFQVEITG